MRPFSLIFALPGWLFFCISGAVRRFVVWFANCVVGPILWRTEIQRFRDKSELCFAKYEGERLWEMLESGFGANFFNTEYPLCPFDEVVAEICRRRIMWPHARRFLTPGKRTDTWSEICFQGRCVCRCEWTCDGVRYYDAIDRPACRMDASVDFYDSIWDEMVAAEGRLYRA